MIWKPKQLGRQNIEERELEADKKNCRRFGPCGVGQKALYLNSFYFDRRYYVALDSVSRVFKRVAMSKGGFSGKGMFATIPYLVVQYDGGEEVSVPRCRCTAGRQKKNCWRNSGYLNRKKQGSLFRMRGKKSNG